MKRLLPLLLCFALLLSVGVWAEGETADAPDAGSAGTTDAAEPEAQDLTAQCTVYCNGGLLSSDMLDDSFFTRGVLPAGSVLKVVCSTPIAGIYVRFDQTGKNIYPEAWTLEVNGETQTCGENGFQQQYVGGFSATELTMTFSAETGVSDLYFLSAGSLPDWVHDWQPEPEKADVLLMACHSDDDQYTFCGLIPWCLGQGVTIHVAYFINHYTHPNRVHELLNGLWASGIRCYPTLGLYRDEEHETTLQSYLDTGYTEEELVGTPVDVIRRFRPQVLVTHAVDGEYGHGAHILYTQLILEAIGLTGDASQYPESAAKYGVWDIPKVYVHCYDENQVVLDFDTPLELFGGRTAFRVGQDAFREEVSQTWYQGQMNWLYGHDKAVDVEDHRPCDYGLYRTLVGADTHTDTLLDNIVPYAEQDRLAAEEAAKEAAEAAQKAAAEEAERQAAEAAAAEKAAEEAAQKAAQEEAERQAAEKAAEEAAQQAAARQRAAAVLRIALLALGAGAALFCAILLLRRAVRGRQRRDAVRKTEGGPPPSDGADTPETESAPNGGEEAEEAEAPEESDAPGEPEAPAGRAERGGPRRSRGRHER